jgi:hypothetical protein
MVEPNPDADDDQGTPRWVRVSGAICAVLVVLVVITMLAGHGPWRHFAGGGGAAPTAASGLAAPVAAQAKP